MSVLLTLLLAAGPPPEEVVVKNKPKMRCERVHEVGTIRLKRVCYPADKPAQSEGQRRENVERIREQAEREKQLDKDNMGDKPL